MIALPKRTDLVRETIQVLKQWILAGVLKDVLPGELLLKEQLQVGRDTLRLALQALEKEGWLAAASQGKKRRVAARKSSKAGSHPHKLPVMFVSPYPPEHARHLNGIDYTIKRLTDLGGEMQFVSPNIFHLKNPEKRLQSLLQTYAAAGWVLYANTPAMQRWFSKQKVATLICGQPYPGVNLPYVTLDWEPAGFHAGLQFIRHGHGHIGMFGFVERGAGAMAIESGVRRALKTSGKRAQLTMFEDERTPESIVRCYEAAFKAKDRITAMVLTSSEHLLTCLSWMVSKGIRVPADVSVVVMPYEEWYSDFYPPICHYKPNVSSYSQVLAERVAEMVQHAHVIRKSSRTPLEFVPGASIGPAPRLS